MESGKKSFLLRVTPELESKLAEQAKQLGLTKNTYAVMLLTQAVEKGA